MDLVAVHLRISRHHGPAVDHRLAGDVTMLNVRQTALLALMRVMQADGYEFVWDKPGLGYGRRWSAQQGGRGRGGRCEPMPYRTMEALRRRGYLTMTDDQRTYSAWRVLTER